MIVPAGYIGVVFALAVALNADLCTAVGNGLNEEHQCFCKLRGEVDDCSCKVQSVDSFNNYEIFPRINELVKRDYFRYAKVNIERPCKFRGQGKSCTLKDCAVKPCSQADVPDGLKNTSEEKEGRPSDPAYKYTEQAQKRPHTATSDGGCSSNAAAASADDGPSGGLSKLDRSISQESLDAFKNWTAHDDSQDYNFCELDDDTSPDMIYADLLLNPERYTGYAGASAHSIWRMMYKENCFSSPEQESRLFTTSANRYEDTCIEKRAFFRLISGLHTSINIHLSARYYFAGKNIWEGRWDINPAEFQRRFDPKTTGGLGPQWLKNLYFLYLVELRALSKIAPYLENETFYTGNADGDAEVQKLVHDLLHIVKSFPDHFDESKLFQGDAAVLKEQVRLKFMNVSRIIDCIGCDKCRLWGKIQVQGLGTALKILFSGDMAGPDTVINHQTHRMPSEFQLRRMEIVSLVNAIGRLSTSIKYIDDFRRLLNSGA